MILIPELDILDIPNFLLELHSPQHYNTFKLKSEQEVTWKQWNSE